MDGRDAYLSATGVSDDNSSDCNHPTIKIESETNGNVGGAENFSSGSSIGSTTSLNNAINSEPSPSDSNSIPNQDDSKSNSTTSSAQYSMTDNSEKSDSKRTLLNKYVKKVKSPWKSLLKK